MRSTRALLAGSAATLLGLVGSLVPSPARADTTPSYDGLPSSWTFQWFAHATPDYGSTGITIHQEGNAAPGFGTGSLDVSLGPVTEGWLSRTTSLNGLTSAQVWIQSGTLAVPPESVKFFVDTDADGTPEYVGTLPVNDVWTQTDLFHLPMVAWGTTTTAPTLGELAATNPGSAVLTLAVNNGYDAGGAHLFVDGWTTTRNGVTRTVDFEGPHIETVCTITAATTRIVAGDEVPLTGTAKTTGGAPVRYLDLDLFGQMYGETEPRLLTHETMGSQGTVGGIASVPTRRITLAWVLPQDATYGRCHAETVTVRVATRITSSADYHVRKGHVWSMHGLTKPSKPGTSVTLWAVTPRRPIKVTVGQVASDGTYRFGVKFGRTGSYKFFVTGAGGEGNLPGKSRAKSVIVY